jgi:hypothetical protein
MVATIRAIQGEIESKVLPGLGLKMEEVFG